MAWGYQASKDGASGSVASRVTRGGGEVVWGGNFQWRSGSPELKQGQRAGRRLRGVAHIRGASGGGGAELGFQRATRGAAHSSRRAGKTMAAVACQAPVMPEVEEGWGELFCNYGKV